VGHVEKILHEKDKVRVEHLRHRHSEQSITIIANIRIWYGRPA